MYYDHFGLQQPPFRITPDTRLFFPGANRGAVLDALVYAIVNGEGIVKVVGEVGSGKTMLCRMLEEALPEQVDIVYLANPRLSPENILHAIAFELKLPVQAGTSRIQVLNQLQNYLLRRHAENRQVVIFVEEAQGMPLPTLEEIRLLSNLETKQHKLLQIVLFGQPELDELLARTEIRQLRERITYSFHLPPFQGQEIGAYLDARLRACGHGAGALFTDAAVQRIGRYTAGLVRRINILADKSLLAAYADGAACADVQHVERAARDSEFHRRRNWLRGWRLPTALGVVLLAVAATWAGLNRNRAPALAPPVLAPAPASPAAGPLAPEPGVRDPAPATAPPGAQENDENQTDRIDPAVTDAARAEGTLPPAHSAPSDAGATPDGVPPAEVALPVAGQVPEPDAVIAPRDEVAGDDPRTPLLGLAHVEALQDSAGPPLGAEELTLLRRQLEALPPEEFVGGNASPDGDACALCWAIIYRPLRAAENL